MSFVLSITQGRKNVENFIKTAQSNLGRGRIATVLALVADLLPTIKHISLYTFTSLIYKIHTISSLTGDEYV